MSTATAAKERPILFSGPMVRAILDGRKTQTRRIVKFGAGVTAVEEVNGRQYPGEMWPGFMGECGDWQRLRCPYGQPGNRLWVRETFATYGPRDGACIREYSADRPHCKPIASDKWRPSIHMPRWASRITLELTDVCVERLQEISEEDAQAEGVPFNLMASTHKLGFFNLWNSIHGCNADQANPWVWVLSFRRITP
jgi:hypothetical protein